MAEWKRAEWRKLHRRAVSSSSHVGIGPNARSLLLTLIGEAWWDEESPEGRLLESSNPHDAMSIEQLGRLSDLTQGQARAALERLVKKETAAIDNHGVVILPKFRKWQRGESYERVKRHRDERFRNASPPTAPAVAETDIAESREQRAEPATQVTPVAPKGASPPVEAKPPRQAKPRKPRATYPDGLEEHFLAELQRACRDFRGRPDAGPRKVTDGMRDELRKLYAAEEPSAAEISRAVNRRLELNRSGDQYGDLTWEHLCRPASFRRYRDAMPAGPNGKSPGDDEPPDWMLE